LITARKPGVNNNLYQFDELMKTVCSTCANGFHQTLPLQQNIAEILPAFSVDISAGMWYF